MAVVVGNPLTPASSTTERESEELLAQMVKELRQVNIKLALMTETEICIEEDDPDVH